MMELVFVIVVIGILGMIAIPKFAVTRDDATIVNAKSIVANIRTAINNEVQARVMRGDYTKIKDLGGTLNGYNSDIQVDFNVSNNRFDCDGSDKCKYLER